MRDAIAVPWDRPAPCVMTNEWKGRLTDPSWWKKLNNASDALALVTKGARRKLTLGECAALQPFPAGYPFAGAIEARYRKVGNAVPPTLAAAVARARGAAEEGAASIRESLPALGAFADRVLAKAIALVRARSPRGVDPHYIDGFVDRNAGWLRAHVAYTLYRWAA